MNSFFETVDQYKKIINSFKDQAEYIFMIVTQKTSKELDGMFSDKLSTKEFEIYRKNYSIFTKIINKKKEITFNCNNIMELKDKIEESIQKLKTFAKDFDIVIPKTKELTVIDNNSIHKIENLNDIYQTTELLIKKMYKKYISNVVTNILVRSDESESIILDSNGFVYFNTRINNHLTVEFITDKDNIKYSDYLYYNMSLHSKNTKKYIEKTLNMLKNQIGSTAIFTDKYPCIFENNLASSIISNIIDGINGEMVDRKATIYKDLLNKQILPTNVNIIEKPKSKYYVSSYDYEGFKLKKKSIVENGILKIFLVDSKFSKKLKHKKTGNAFGGIGITNVFVESKEKFDKQKFQNGVIIQKIVSDNVNLVTGDFKASCSGIEIKNGKETPFNNAVIVFNLMDLKNMQLVNDSLYEDGDIFVSSIYLPEVQIAGT